MGNRVSGLMQQEWAQDEHDGPSYEENRLDMCACVCLCVRKRWTLYLLGWQEEMRAGQAAFLFPDYSTSSPSLHPTQHQPYSFSVWKQSVPDSRKRKREKILKWYKKEVREWMTWREISVSEIKTHLGSLLCNMQKVFSDFEFVGVHE